MKKLLAMLTILAIMLSTCIMGIGTEALALEASPESDFIAFGGVIEDYVGEGGVLVIPAEIDGVPTTEIAADVFLNNTKITEVYLPEGLEKLGHRAFKGCSNITKIELPYSLTLLGTEVFHTCTALTEITIPGSIEKIPYNTFGDSSAISKINISYGVKEIHSHALGRTIVERIVFPESVELISAYAMNYIKRKGTFEIVICNPNLDLGRVPSGKGLYNDMMNGNWTDKIDYPWNSTFGDKKSVFNVIVPKGSKIAEFVKDWQNNGLLRVGEDEAVGKNSYNVIEKDESYFKSLKENQSDFGITAPRTDLTFTSGSGGSTPGTTTPGTTTPGTTTPGTTTPGTTAPGTTAPGTTTPGTTEPGTTTPGSTDSDTGNNANNSSGGSITTVYEEDNSLGTVLMIVGIVFGVLIIGIVVLAVVMAKKKAPAEEIAEEAEEETAADETPAEDAE